MKLDRRSFLTAASATGMLSTVPSAASGEAAGTRFAGWKPGEFQVHLIYTGVAESQFLIFPDGTSLLLDCGDHPAIMRHQYAVPVPDPRSMAGETIADYVLKVNPRGREVDYLVVSHFHDDHVGGPNWQSCGSMVCRTREYYRSGFGIAAEKLRFAVAVDRGWPDYDDPQPWIEGPDRELEHMRKVYAFLQRRDGLKIEKFRLGAVDQFVPRHGGAPDFEAFNLCANGRIAKRDGTVVNALEGLLEPGVKFNENALSLGHVFSYGPFRYYTAGDFSHGCRYDRTSYACLQGGIEDRMAECCGPVDVAKINHHGHHSMPPKLVAALRARCYLACLWDQLHVTRDAMRTMSDRTLYPGGRTFYPGVFPAERLQEDSAESWLADVAEAVRRNGAHIVLTVPRGGESYTVACLDPYGAELTVRSIDTYRVRAFGGSSSR